jgi:hypothetical protein
MNSRRSHGALAVLGLLAALFIYTFADAAVCRGRRNSAVVWEAYWVRQLGLTDLCLFTEARYTRHLSQADLHSAFQDHPGALEHFPSGALTAPPSLRSQAHARVD